MNIYNKIYWKKGLDITPEILINSDNYHIEERSILGSFCASRLYGIMPNRKFYINININADDNILYIDSLDCLAITKDGYIININGEIAFNREVSLNDIADTECYVILTVDPYSNTLIDNENLQVSPEYNIVLVETLESIERGIPVLKLRKNIYREWKMDEIYIPPSVVLYSVDKLINQYFEIKKKLNEIINKLPEKDASCKQAMLFSIELDNYSLQESPQELILLLKKFCWILKLYLRSEKKIKELPNVDIFTNEIYNHNEVGYLLNLCLISLIEIEENTEEKPVIEEDEIKI